MNTRSVWNVGRWRGAMIVLGAAAALAACGTTASVRSAPGVNVAVYKTFAFASPLGTDRSGYASFLSESLKSATRAALEAKGYQYSETGPQMLVNFNANSQQRTDVEPMPGMMAAPGLLGFRAGLYGAWPGYGAAVNQYDESTLIIDLVDAGKKQLVWEGSSSFDSNDASKWTDKDVQRVVGEVIAKVPPAG